MNGKLEFSCYFDKKIISELAIENVMILGIFIADTFITKIFKNRILVK